MVLIVSVAVPISAYQSVQGALLLTTQPGDIDAVWVNGYGWPRATGGIMYWAGVR